MVNSDCYPGIPLSEQDKDAYEDLSLVNQINGSDVASGTAPVVNAGHKCEIDTSNPSFLRRNSSILYTEPHHLVPMNFQDGFDVSLDIEENIVALCSNCHNQIHYGTGAKALITQLYNARKNDLKRVGIEIDLETLLAMYKL